MQRKHDINNNNVENIENIQKERQDDSIDADFDRSLEEHFSEQRIQEVRQPGAIADNNDIYFSSSNANIPQIIEPGVIMPRQQTGDITSYFSNQMRFVNTELMAEPTQSLFNQNTIIFVLGLSFVGITIYNYMYRPGNRTLRSALNDAFWEWLKYKLNK